MHKLQLRMNKQSKHKMQNEIQNYKQVNETSIDTHEKLYIGVEWGKKTGQKSWYVHATEWNWL